MPSGEPDSWWPATLTTGRLLLRPVEPADVTEVSRLWTDPVVRRYLGGPVSSEEVTRLRRAYVGSPGHFCVLRQPDNTTVGLVSIKPAACDGKTEVGYELLPEHWGHGYAREAVAATVAWALDTLTSAPREVVAVTQQANTRSRRLLESIGMTQVATFTEWNAPQVMYSIRA